MALGPRQSGWWVGILGSLHYLGVRLIVSVPFCFVPFIHSFTGVYFSVVSAVGTQVAQWEDFTEEVVLFILDLKNKYDSAPPPLLLPPFSVAVPNYDYMLGKDSQF